MPRVLLINLDRTEQIRSLLTDRTIDLSVITTKENSFRYKKHSVCAVNDITNIMQAHKAALRLARLGPFNYVVTPLERALIPAGMIRSNLGIKGLTYDQTLGFANKFVMKDRIRRAGIPVTSFRLLPHVSMMADAGAEIGWPVIIKPIIGSGSQYTYRLASEQHARSLLTHDSDLKMLARRSVPMLAECALNVTAEFHCDAVISRGNTIFCSISQYIHPLLDCVGTFAGSFILDENDPLSPLIKSLHTRCIDALALTDGVTHFEVFLTPDGLVFGEIACRPGGSGVASNVERKYGVDLWEVFVNLQLGREPCLKPPSSSGTSIPAEPGDPIIAWLGVPARNGKVVAITPPSEFATIPGVQGTKMLYQVGDVINERAAVGSLAAYIYFTAQGQAEVYDIVKKISAAYYIQTTRADGLSSR